MPELIEPPVAEMTQQAFIEKGRDYVLAALDAYVQEILGIGQAKGWRDQDLPQLLPALDKHLQTVALRLADPNSPEPGSALIRIRA